MNATQSFIDPNHTYPERTHPQPHTFNQFHPITTTELLETVSHDSDIQPSRFDTINVLI